MAKIYDFKTKQYLGVDLDDESVQTRRSMIAENWIPTPAPTPWDFPVRRKTETGLSMEEALRRQERQMQMRKAMNERVKNSYKLKKETF